LMAAAAETHRDAPVVVAPSRRDLAGGQRFHGLAFVERGAVDQDQLALARRRRLVMLECHGSCFPPLYSPVVTSVRSPSSRVTMAFFTSDSMPRLPRKLRTLPLRMSVLTCLTLTSNSFSTASLICGLVACGATRKTTWLRSEAIVAFSVMTGDTMMSSWRGSLGGVSVASPADQARPGGR